MKKPLKVIIVLGLAAVGLWFIVSALSKSTRSPVAVLAPELPKVPARVYGIVEPAGGDVYVTSAVNRPVVHIFVREGDFVHKGHKILQLESELEHAQHWVAWARWEAARKAAEISRYHYERQRQLYQEEAIAEYDYQMARLQAQRDSLNLEVAVRELQLAQEQLDRLVLWSPIDGIVYKLDVRLGELFGGGDEKSIILGAPGLWVRLYVESFWKDRFNAGTKCQVYDSETQEYIGLGTVISKARYLTGRDFRTEDVTERFDAEFEQVILELQTDRESLPLGLHVMATPAESDRSESEP